LTVVWKTLLECCSEVVRPGQITAPAQTPVEVSH